MSEKIISMGDTVDHSEYGEVEIKLILESLDNVLLTNTGDDVVFDGSTVVETYVSFITDEEKTITQPMDQFMENIEVQG